MIAEVIKMREEEKKRSSLKQSIRSVFKKRWVLPAIYISCAALLLTAVIWFQTGGKNVAKNNDNEATDVSGNNLGKEPALEVNQAIENIAMPVTNPDVAVIKQHFYDSKAKKEDQEAALVFYNNQYHPNTGVNIGQEDGKTFDVVAALSGNVTKVEDDSLLGNIIEIQHDDGIVTQYQSLQDIQVSAGDFVEQGEVLAKAGQSMFNKEAGVHVHFEIRRNNVALNPLDYFDKPLSALQDEEQAEKDASAEEEKLEEPKKNTDEKKQSDKKDEPMEKSKTDKKDEKSKTKSDVS